MQPIQWRRALLSVWWAWALFAWTLLMTLIPWMGGLLFAHIMSAIIWTGTDLFLGLMLGPALNKIPAQDRIPFVRHLFPRNLWMMPIIAASTLTSGYFIALREHLFTSFPLPLILAGIFVAAMTVNGFGIILPTNYVILKMSEQPGPPPANFARKMTRFRYAVNAETFLQLGTIICMVWLAQLPPG